MSTNPQNQQNVEWCWLDKSPCRLLTGNIVPSNHSWVMCYYKSAMQIDCSGNKIFVYCNRRNDILNLRHFNYIYLDIAICISFPVKQHQSQRQNQQTKPATVATKPTTATKQNQQQGQQGSQG